MCEYCGCQSNTVIGRFMDEHETLINLTGDLGRALERGDGEAAEKHRGAIAGLLLPHTMDEEVGIFAEMKKIDVYRPGIEQLCAEHDTIDELLVKAQDDASFARFELALRRHIDEENNGLFPAANIELMGDGWERVDEAMHAAQHTRGEAHAH